MSFWQKNIGNPFNFFNKLDKLFFNKNQLVECLKGGTVVPFVGAGLSASGGFPTWKEHLRQQGRTAGINPVHINSLLDNGQYENIIAEIQKQRGRDVLIQEIRDVFSRTGSINENTLRLTELFSDTIITTNYDRLIEQAYDTGQKDSIQIINCVDIVEKPIPHKVTIIKLHGNIKNPEKCIISKEQYDQAYGPSVLDLSRPIPKLISLHYRTSNLLFLGCSLNKDRTMEVFKAVKDKMGDTDRPPQHFSIEQTPETEAELIERNAYLLDFGITAIWFEKGCFDFVESILRLARNEVRYAKGILPTPANEREGKTSPCLRLWDQLKKKFQPVNQY